MRVFLEWICVTSRSKVHQSLQHFINITIFLTLQFSKKKLLCPAAGRESERDKSRKLVDGGPPSFFIRYIGLQNSEGYTTVFYYVSIISVTRGGKPATTQVFYCITISFLVYYHASKRPFMSQPNRNPAECPLLKNAFYQTRRDFMFIFSA